MGIPEIETFGFMLFAALVAIASLTMTVLIILVIDKVLFNSRMRKGALESQASNNEQSKSAKDETVSKIQYFIIMEYFFAKCNISLFLSFKYTEFTKELKQRRVNYCPYSEFQDVAMYAVILQENFNISSGEIIEFFCKGNILEATFQAVCTDVLFLTKLYNKISKQPIDPGVLAFVKNLITEDHPVSYIIHHPV